jgi:hypothetical protein
MTLEADPFGARDTPVQTRANNDMAHARAIQGRILFTPNLPPTDTTEIALYPKKTAGNRLIPTIIDSNRPLVREIPPTQASLHHECRCTLTHD